ncbi:protein kinase [Streptomyces sp. NPDC088354]|uniref:protein kinase domain-containing protein n=1 Tax=unclassified Streptomyces TaxID=2593676 RepID=UPI0037F9B72B
MGRKIGSRYTAHQVLGRGSAGTVWLGEGPEGPVAIKLLREDLASDQDLVGRFVQERTALLALHHPHIVGIRDLVVDGSDLALVMDLVRGTDLRSRLERERRLAPEAAVSVTADVADGLAAAHAAGVVHRDVKPENVLLDSAAPPGPGGAPPALLTDFGIARLVDSPRRTRATRIIGTPDYLAPEIIEGLPPRASVDIYALATVLYELLAGFTPFGGGHPGAVLRRHVTESVAPLPDLPDELWQLLSQCLAKAPASRLTAAEVATRLRELLPDLAGLPPLEVDAPGDHHHEDAGGFGAEPAGAGEPYDPPAGRRRGAVPLVRGAAPDSTRDTHTSIKLPTAEELAAGRAAGDDPRGSRARHRHRAVADSPQRRRAKIGAAAAAALVAAGLGGWAIAASGSDDGGSTSREDREPGDSTTHAPTPTAPTGAAASPQGAVSSPADAADTAGEASLHWSGLTALPPLPVAGVETTGRPRAVSAAGATYVFTRGTDRNLWYLVDGGWHRLTGISVADDPSAVSSRAGQLDVFALGTDHKVYRRTLSDGAWGGWYQVDQPATFDTTPAAASSAPGRIDLVARSDGDLVTSSWVDGRWNAWALVPTAGRITSAPGLVSRARGTLDAFVVRKADGAVLRLPYVNGAWRPSELVPGLDATGRPEAAVSGGRLYVLAPSGGGALAAAVGAGSGWAPVPVSATSRTGATLTGSAKSLTLYVRRADGALARSTGSPVT